MSFILNCQSEFVKDFAKRQMLWQAQHDTLLLHYQAMQRLLRNSQQRDYLLKSANQFFQNMSHIGLGSTGNLDNLFYSHRPQRIRETLIG